MAEADALQTLAEFGIALAGFTGIVVAFRSGALHPADRFRVSLALVASLAAAFLALVPVGFHLIGLQPWRLSGAILAAATIAILVHNVVQQRRLPADIAALLSTTLQLFLRTILVGAFLVGACLAGDALAGGAYFFAVLLLLAVAAAVFVRVVFVRPPA